MAASSSTQQPARKAHSTLILGAGVFGASTAYYLAKSRPDEAITLVDRSTGVCQNGASWDWNKIIRADYEDPFYMKLALEAMDLWTTDPLFLPFFRCTGAAWLMPDPEFLERVARNYQALRRQPDFEIITAEEMKTRYDGVFEGADMSGVDKIFLNRSSGVAQAKEALAALINEAVRLGVRNVALDVERLLFDNGACVGIESHNGEQIKADRVILCTGAYTPKLLADSVPLQSQLKHLTAAASVVGILKLDPERLARFIKNPVFIHNISKTPGEALPAGSDGILKFTRNLHFKNTSLHSPSGEIISAPPDGPHYNQWSPPESLKKELEAVRRAIHGDLTTDIPFGTYRLCWDAYAPDDNFFITPHPHLNSLFLATGGSFHGWKMIPVIGKYVVQMLEGLLNDECKQRWAWDRPMPTVPTEGAPERELRDA